MKKTFLFHVIPRSGKNEIIPLEDGTYRVKITAAPVDGEANKKLIKLLSEYFQISKSSFTLLKGKTSRTKTIEIDT